MTAEEQIKASIYNGLAIRSIEALLGRPLTPSETQLYQKHRAIFIL